MSSLDAIIITYNQAAFIRKAIQGALSQKLDIPYRILVHDDASTDGTRAILRALSVQYPGRIELHLAKKNKGMCRSWQDALQLATASFVAICEGDDYWTDNHKLQKQVDFLEAHPEYSICCHRVFVKRGNKAPRLVKDEFAPASERTWDIAMMARQGNLVATPSVVYRNGLFSNFPAWFDKAPVADYVLHLLNAKKGKIKYLPAAMAVYRQHSSGAWGGRSPKENAKSMAALLGLLLGEPFDESVKVGLREQRTEQWARYLLELLQEDWNTFEKEFTAIHEQDPGITIGLLRSIKTMMDAYSGSRAHRLARHLQKIKML